MTDPRERVPLTSERPEFNAVVRLARAGDVEQLRQRRDSGDGIDVVDEHGRCAVLTVTMLGDLDALRCLIDAGADVDHFDAALAAEVIDPTAFLYAGAAGMTEALELLIAAGARPDIYNYYGGTALIPAAEKGHVDAVRVLLEKSRVDVNHVNRLGWTALMEAVILSDGGEIQRRIVELLLAHGADPDIPDHDGTTAAAHAQRLGYTTMLSLLRPAGCRG